MTQPSRPRDQLAILIVATAFATAPARGDSPDRTGPSARDYPTIQAAIDANPGRPVHLPAGDYEVSEAIRINKDRSGLLGPGRIVQTNPDRPIVRVDGASGVQIRGVTLTRPEGKRETTHEAVIAIGCRDLVIDDVQVIDNRTRTAAVELRNCAASQVRHCLVRNYQCVSVDDRTANAELGYAFKCIIGTGVLIREGRGILIEGNRVVEDEMIATPERKSKYDLGRYTKKNATRGRLASAKDWADDYTQNWHQGTAIHIASPESTDYTQVIGNYIENAGQGIDVHADHVTLANNIVNDALIGMKAMHGSRHVVIVGNQFSKTSLWSIGLMPGAASHAARPAEGRKKAVGQNIDGGSIIANNIISDFGYGHTYWIRGVPDAGAPIRFDAGQTPENPPLSEVVVQGNIVSDAGRDLAPPAPPRFKYAVLVEQGGPNAPRGLHFSNNILHAGTRGVSNVELKP
jgi:hypothetical protein